MLSSEEIIARGMSAERLQKNEDFITSSRAVLDDLSKMFMNTAFADSANIILLMGIKEGISYTTATLQSYVEAMRSELAMINAMNEPVEDDFDLDFAPDTF